MKSKKIINLIFLIPLAIYIIYKVTSSIIEDRIESELLGKEYPTLMIENKLNSEVIDVYFPEHYTGKGYSKFITLTNNKKIYIRINDNEKLEKDFFGVRVKKGSWLKKDANSDTLFLIVDNKTYIYTIY